MKAREEEIETFGKHRVWDLVDIEIPRKKGMKLIKVKWVDINKGDSKDPEYRSRLVAKEIKRDKRMDMFAATPPLEAKKLLLYAMAVTEGIGCKKENRKR